MTTKTAAPVEAKTRAINSPVTPEFIRLPQVGTSDPHTGLKRSKMNELVLPSPTNNFKPPVRSICLRNKGQQKGVRLIVFASLMEYLRGLEVEQNKMRENLTA